MIKSNELEIITRDAGASGRHSHAAHGNEELFVLFNKIYHIVIFMCPTDSECSPVQMARRLVPQAIPMF